MRIVLLTGILVIAAFFRLWQLDVTPPGLFPDEAMNGNNAYRALNETGFKVFYPENNGREGLFINIQALSTKVFGNTAFALRVVSAFFGILTVLALYCFARAYTGSYAIALLSSFFLATSYWHIHFSRIGFRAIMAPFFLTAGLAALYTTWNKRDDKNHARALWISVLGGILFGLGFHSYIAYRAAPLLLLPVLILFVRSARKNHTSCTLCLPAMYLFFALIVTVPLLLYFAAHQADFFGRTSQISIFSLPNPAFEFAKNLGTTLQMFYFAGDFNWRHNLAGAPQLWWPVAIFFTLGFIESIRKKYWLLPLWFFAMILPVAISSEGLPHALRSIIIIPPVFVFAGIGFYTLTLSLKQFFDKRMISAVCIIVFALTALHTYNAYFQRWAKYPETYAAFGGNLYEIGLYLKSQPTSIPKYVVTDEVDHIDKTGRPMAIEPILFASETYLPVPNGGKNIFYLTLNDAGSIDCSDHCIVIPIGNMANIRTRIKEMIPTLQAISVGNIITLQQ